MTRTSKCRAFILISLTLSLVQAAYAAEDCDRLIYERKYLAYFHCTGDGDDLISVHNRSVALSFMGEDSQGESIFEKEDVSNALATPRTMTGRTDIAGYVRHDALPMLAKMAASRQLVMLNEAHHVSRHRIFALQLARHLKKQGFKYLAAEGLSNATRTQQSGYVSLDNRGAGYYTADPEFAYFLREAVAIGFQLAVYEAHNTDTIADRERGQAENIVALLKRDPGAKIFVYAGYAHISERRTQKGDDWMAKRVKDLTGIDPLTIDQVGGTPHYFSILNDPAWVQASSVLTKGPSIFIKGADTLVSDAYKGSADVTVFHPAARFIDRRPDWLYHGRKKHFVSSDLIGGIRPAMVRAVRSNDQNGVPVDQALTRNADGVTLLLPPGTYIIEVEALSTGNKRLYQTSIH